MDEGSSQDEVTIFDKDESSEHAINIVGGFVIEESQKPFPNGKLSFVPEEYGKKDPPPPPSRPSRSKANTTPKEDPSLPPGMAKCEFCGAIAEGETFLAPSRRFCTVTCCKRYSAEKRYYPYGRDEEGVAMSIRQGLVNKHRSLRPTTKPKKAQQQTVREERQRRLAYYKKSGTGESTPSTTPRGGNRKGGKRNPPSAGGTPVPSASATRVLSNDQTPGSQSFVEPYSHPHGTPLAQWTVDDVSDFLVHLGYEAYVDKFTEHEIDGRALSLVQDHHLLMTLKLRLGPTLKITEHISMLKNIEEVSEQ